MRIAHISHDRSAICPFTRVSPAASMGFASGVPHRPRRRRAPPVCSQGELMDKQAATGLVVADSEVPDWWPYAREVPHWHVWRGIAGLLYARRLMSSPPRVVRSQDPAELLNQIKLAELHL